MSPIASTEYAISLGKSLYQGKLQGPETYERWNATIINLLKETICTDKRELIEGVNFKDVAVYDCIFPQVVNNELPPQHPMAQRFAQQLLMSTIDDKNYDLIKVVPDEGEDITYNRAKLQMEALQEEHQSNSTSRLNVLYQELHNIKIDDYKKSGIKDSKAIAEYFQEQANLIHKINGIVQNPMDESLLLFKTKQALPERFRVAGRDASSIDVLKYALINHASMYTDGTDTQEEAFSTTAKDKDIPVTAKDKNKPRPRRFVCHSFTHFTQPHSGLD